MYYNYIYKLTGAEDGIVVLDDQKTGILNRSPISSDDSHVTCDSLHHVAKPQKVQIMY